MVLNLRYEIISRIKDGGILPREDLIASLVEIPGIKKDQVSDSINSLVTSGFVVRVMDESTKKTAYRLTPLGVKRYEQGPGSIIGTRRNAPIAVAPIQVEQAIPALAERQIAPTPSSDLQAQICALDSLLRKAADERNAWHESMAIATGAETPQDAVAFIAGLTERNARLFDESKRQREIISKLEAKIIALNDAQNAAVHNETNHPAHYGGRVECIDAIQSAMTPAEFVGYCRGNVLKYTWRAGKKGPARVDLSKAAWYLDKLQSA